MRLLVCGGRAVPYTKETYAWVSNNIADALGWVAVEDDMDTWLAPDGTVIIHGVESGIDFLADQWAVSHWVPIKEYRADWENLGKNAGAIRNQQMIDEGKPDLVLVFPGGMGTADVVKRAKKAGIPIKEVYRWS